MNRLSYLLASTLSAIAALVSGAASAKATAADTSAKHDTIRTESPSGIAISPAARDQIYAQARQRTSPSATKPKTSSPAAKPGALAPKTGSSKKPKASFVQAPPDFDQSPGFSEFSKGKKKKTKSKPGGAFKKK